MSSGGRPRFGESDFARLHQRDDRVRGVEPQNQAAGEKLDEDVEPERQSAGQNLFEVIQHLQKVEGLHFELSLRAAS